MRDRRSVRRSIPLAALLAVAALAGLARPPLAFAQVVPPPDPAPTYAVSVGGSWGPVLEWPHVPVSMANLPDGRILTFASNEPNDWPNSIVDEYTHAAVWDPASGDIRSVPHPSHDMFCAAMVTLEDGEVFVMGGRNAADSPWVSYFDFHRDRWVQLADDMHEGRWYPTAVHLPSGEVFVAGGLGAGIHPERWTPDEGWSILTGIDLLSSILSVGFVDGGGLWPLLQLAPDGTIFHHGAVDQMNRIEPFGGPNGLGTITDLGPHGAGWFPDEGVSVTYDEGKILVAGGSIFQAAGASSAQAFTIDINGPGPVVSPAQSMHYPRQFLNEVLLPTGDVLVVGGNTDGRKFDDDFAIRNAEIWNPTTGAWTLLNPQDQARTYHSTALLLVDGTVLSAGGGLDGDVCTGSGAPGECGVDHWNAEIFSPPYLFAPDGSPATRPEVLAAPGVARVGRTLRVYATAGLDGFSLVRMSATTHTMNTDQRFLRPTTLEIAPGVYDVTLASNPNVLVPGFWMLFALDAGVPSIAHVVQVVDDGTPRGPPIDGMQSEVGDTILLPLDLEDPDGAPIAYAGTGLPPGLTIDPATGVISGTVDTPGLFNVSLTADDGVEILAIDFPWIVSDELAEVGFRLSSPSLWTEVDFVHHYEVPVVVLGPFSNFDPAPAVARVREVDPSGFALRIDPWPYLGGASRLAEIVDYLVVESGVYLLPSGETLAAGRATGIDHSNPWFQPFPDGAFDTAPIVLAQVASTSAGAGSPPSVARVDGVTTAGFTVRLQEQEADDQQLPAEEVHWIAVEPTLVPGQLEAAIAPQPVTDQTSSISYAQGYADPLHIFAGALSLVEEDPISLRATGRTLAGFGIWADEEESADAEVFHAGESLGWLAISSGTTTLGLLPLFNAPPVLAVPPDRTSRRGQSPAFPIVAVDPEGDPLTFTAQGLPPGIVFDAATGAVSGTLTTTGVFVVEIDVADSSGDSDAGQFVWTVEERLDLLAFPTPPTLSTQVDYTALTSIPGDFLFSWDFGDGSAGQGPTATPDVTHDFPDPGRYVVTLSVEDPETGQTDTRQLVQIVAPTPTAGAPAASSSLAYEAGADRIWVANPDQDSVSVIDAVTQTRLAEIAVSAGPRTLALAADGRVWVACKEGAAIDVIDPIGLGIVEHLALQPGVAPFGLVFDPGGSTAWVTLEGSGEIVRIDGPVPVVGARVPIGRDVRHLARSADGATLYAPRFVTPPLPGEATGSPATSGPIGGEVLTLDTATLTPGAPVLLGIRTGSDTATRARGVPNHLGTPAIAPDGGSLFVPSKQDNVYRGAHRDGLPLEHDRTVRAITSRVDLASATEVLADRLDHDDAGVAHSARFSALGAYLFVTLEASREVSVIDPFSRLELGRFGTGRAPHGLALSPDGRTLYVDEFMDRSVSVYDLGPLLDHDDTSLAAEATIPKRATEVLAADVFLGKQLFYDAIDPRLAFQGYLSCAACHAEGGGDGRVWDFTDLGEGLRNTIDLRGHGQGMGPLHWTANFDEFQDFEGQIRHFQGQGLMSNTDFAATSDPLGAPKAGLSADLDALAAYLASLDAIGESPYRALDGSLTPEAEAGALAFAAAGCGGCHAGSAFSDSATGASHDVGTLTSASGSATALDTPTLRGLWRTEPYLHDGSAPTLADAIDAHANPSLTPADRDAIAAYLLQIDDLVAAPLNGAPSVAIESPAPGVRFIAGATVELVAAATDPEEGDLSDAIDWSVEGLGTIATGPSLSFPSFTAGDLTFTATITDAAGETRDDSLTIGFDPNGTPEVEVHSPAVGTTVGEGLPVLFSATATDPEEGDLSFAIVWSSSLDGDLGVGASLTTTALSLGQHLITARVVDSYGGFESSVTTLRVLANGSPPVTTIVTPAGGSVFTEARPVPLSATASDPDDGDLSASIEWGSDLDGALGTGASISPSNLSVGAHLITATVTDSSGRVASADVDLVVAANVGPSIVVLEPAAPIEIVVGTPLDLVASASDPEDGDLSASVTWRSDLDGPLGAGASILADALSVGAHSISADVSDGHGATATASTSVTVPEPDFASALAMALCGLGGLANRAARRRGRPLSRRPTLPATAPPP